MPVSGARPLTAIPASSLILIVNPVRGTGHLGRTESVASYFQTSSIRSRAVLAAPPGTRAASCIGSFRGRSALCDSRARCRGEGACP